MATKRRLEDEARAAQDVSGQGIEDAFGFDLAALPAGDADRLGGGCHRDRPVVGGGRWTVGA